jgi:serine/threonine-protein kinase
MKPGNIFVENVPNEEPVAKVLDFGLAKMVGAPNAIRTTLGRALGTPAYMSPEQVTGRPLDGRSDLFAIGIVLYEALAGSRPYNAKTTPELCASILRDEPQPLALARPGLAPRLAGVVHRALEKRPEDRFKSANEFRRALMGMADLPGPYPTQRYQLPSLIAEDDSSSHQS